MINHKVAVMVIKYDNNKTKMSLFLEQKDKQQITQIHLFSQRKFVSKIK